MSEPSLAIGITTTVFTVLIGLALYFLRTPLRIMKMKKEALTELASKEKELSELSKEIENKRAELNKLSKTINKLGKEAKQTNEVKTLRKALEEKQSKNKELEEKIKSLKGKEKKLSKVKQPVKTNSIPKAQRNDEIIEIKHKYPGLPKNQLERIEIERLVARALIKGNGGSFHISQILKSIEGLYPRHIKPDDRLMLLNEIKSWIVRDPLCRDVKTTDKVQHYTFI